MLNLNKNRVLVFILCFVTGFTAAACATRVQPVPSEDISISSSREEQVYDGKTFINTLELPEGPYAKFALPKFTAQISEKYALNSDTVGWLEVPGTTINDVVVWYPGDRNMYYLRRNFEKRRDFNGIFYADYRCTFDGNANGLAPNTVIYGHSMSDDPLDYRKQFSPLKFFKDEEFAKNTPYIYFSASEEDLLWEVFAVFHSSTSLPYNTPHPQDLEALVKECRARSIYNYDVNVTSSDKILTLSTCTYSLPDGRRFPVSDQETGYRYAIMARLVTDKSNLKNEAPLTVNTNLHTP